MRISAISAANYAVRQNNQNQTVNQPAQVSVAQQPSFGAPQKVVKKGLLQTIRELLGIENKNFADELNRQVSNGSMTNEQAEAIAKMKMSNSKKK